MEYENFIAAKKLRYSPSGFDVSDSMINESCFEFQKWTIKTALKAGRFAIWADCGNGKTLMQLECARLAAEKTGKRAILIAPLSVIAQTKREADKFSIDISMIDIINYENVHNIDAENYGCVCLDESSILKNHEGATRNMLIEMFSSVPYKFAFTATPSPNDPMEIGNHSEFLGIMTRQEMLAMFFVNDAKETQKWRLKKPAKGEFYAWVNSWAKMFETPADIGFPNENTTLPPLNFHEFEVTVPKKDNGLLFDVASVSATDFNAELRLTKIDRIDQAADIANRSEDQFIIWVRQNEESQLAAKMINGAVEVYGSMSAEEKADKFHKFQKGEIRVLVTKQKIAQYGLNFQNCRNQIFASLDFSFEGLYQAVRRSWRYGQTKPVNIYIISTNTMSNVLQSIQRKQDQFKEMKKKMIESMGQQNEEKVSGKFPHKKGSSFTAYNSDCVKGISNHVDSESVDFSVFSPPFAELYTYSDDPMDMGNSKDYNEFRGQFKYLVSELLRVTKPGRLVAVHCMDLPIQKGKEGFIGLRDFSGYIREDFEEKGFIFHTRITIWKNPVTEMQRTKAKGLLHKQLKKDSVWSRVGIPDQVLVFRKPGDNAIPITQTMSVDTWQKWASPVWMDIDYGNTLQYTTARDQDDEKHICPLQLDTIHRLIALWSNEGETVLSPFAGIGSEGYEAIKMGRRFVGFELKPSYFRIMGQNLMAAEQLKNQLTLV